MRSSTTSPASALRTSCPGGEGRRILANSTFPAEFLSDNLQIQVNVMDAAHAAGVELLLFLGSSCIYPEFVEQPIREDSRC